MGRIDYGPLTFPVTASHERLVAELRPLGFTEVGVPDASLITGARLDFAATADGFRATVTEADGSPAATTRHGAPVPTGGCFPTASGAVHAGLSVMEERVVRAEPHALHLHAATVVVAGRGIVIPATSGTGKTTLAAELGALGGVVTDEMVAVDRTAGVLRGPRRPLSVKRSGFARARARHPQLTAPDPDEFVWHIPLDAVGIAHVPTVRPGVVLIPERRDGPVEIVEIDPGEAMLAVFDHAYDLDVNPERAFDDLVWLIDRSITVRVRYAEATDVADRLSDWLVRHPESGPDQSARRVAGPDDDVLAVRLGIGEVQWRLSTREVTWLAAD